MACSGTYHWPNKQKDLQTTAKTNADATGLRFTPMLIRFVEEIALFLLFIHNRGFQSGNHKIRNFKRKDGLFEEVEYAGE